MTELNSKELDLLVSDWADAAVEDKVQDSKVPDVIVWSTLFCSTGE